MRDIRLVNGKLPSPQLPFFWVVDLFLDKEILRIPMQDAELSYCANFLAPEEADKYYTSLHGKLAWQQAKINLFGKQQASPRLQAWYGDKGTVYTYSGLSMQAQGWTDELFALKQLCEESTQAKFNSVLANLYRDGSDSMGFHPDNEVELGAKPVIASVSLGAERNFVLKHIKTKESRSLRLQHGSLLIMSGDTQKNWLHGINKTKRPIGPRINLTFRYIHKNANSTNH